jgi:hypothetical protein
MVTAEFAVDLDNGLRVVRTYTSKHTNMLTYTYMQVVQYGAVFKSVAISYTFSGIAGISVPFGKANRLTPSNL